MLVRLKLPVLRLVALVFIVIVLVNPIRVPVALGASPVVHAVLFYSPTCGHCHIVMDRVLPPLAQKYGSQLQVAAVNVQTEEGAAIRNHAIERYSIPSTGVPLMIVGDTYLLGSVDIPDKLPGIITDGLKKDGIAWPDLPGLPEFIETNGLYVSPVTVDVSLPGVNESSNQVTALQDDDPVWMQRFRSDLAGNTIAVIVLAGMLFSVGIIGYTFVQTSEISQLKRGPLGYVWPWWTVPVLCLAGFGVAGYMSYVELTHTQAVCGPIGDCNTVQQSPYATLWGFLPVGIFGLIGYAAILAAWLLFRFAPSQRQNYSAIAMWGMALIGTLFSIYLTFLEPFVIGATCAWCIANAILITLILWATTRPALEALGGESLDDEDDIALLPVKTARSTASSKAGANPLRSKKKKR